MSNWADFVITAVKRGPVLGEISQVQIHEDRDKEFGPPIIVKKHEIASDIKRGKTYITVFKVSENDWEPNFDSLSNSQLYQRWRSSYTNRR